MVKIVIVEVVAKKRVVVVLLVKLILQLDRQGNKYIMMVKQMKVVF